MLDWVLRLLRHPATVRHSHRRLPSRSSLIRAALAKVVLTLAVVLLFLTLAGAAPAQAMGAPVAEVKTLPEVINNATQWIVGILATLGVFFFTVGGLRYMAAGGDPAEVEKAKGAFKGAALGFALAVLAPVLMNIVKQIVGA